MRAGMLGGLRESDARDAAELRRLEINGTEELHWLKVSPVVTQRGSLRLHEGKIIISRHVTVLRCYFGTVTCLDASLRPSQEVTSMLLRNMLMSVGNTKVFPTCALLTAPPPLVCSSFQQRWKHANRHQLTKMLMCLLWGKKLICFHLMHNCYC